MSLDAPIILGVARRIIPSRCIKRRALGTMKNVIMAAVSGAGISTFRRWRRGPATLLRSDVGSAGECRSAISDNLWPRARRQRQSGVPGFRQWTGGDARPRMGIEEHAGAGQWHVPWPMTWYLLFKPSANRPFNILITPKATAARRANGQAALTDQDQLSGKFRSTAVTEDMVLYALDAHTGKQLYSSEKAAAELELHFNPADCGPGACISFVSHDAHVYAFWPLAPLVRTGRGAPIGVFLGIRANLAIFPSRGT